MDCRLFRVRFLFLGYKNGAATPVDYLSTLQQPLNRNSLYFKRIVFVLVLVVLPLDTEVVIRKYPLLVVFAFVDIRIVFVHIFFTSFQNCSDKHGHI